METLNIVKYKETYSQEVQSLIAKDINYIPGIRNINQSLLLFEDGYIVGIGSVWDNKVHPYRKYISIYIRPDKRENGLGKLLFNKLEDKYQYKSFQTAFDSSNIKAVSFAKKYGFNLVRKSYCYDVSEDLLNPYNYETSLEITRLSDLSKKQLEEVISLQYKDYKLNHQKINPLSEEICIREWENIIFNNLSKEDSYIQIFNKHILAYLLCYNIDETSIAIGYTASRHNNLNDYKSFLYNVVNKLFVSYKIIELEIDDYDSSANILGQMFSYKQEDSWDAYIKGY